MCTQLSAAKTTAFASEKAHTKYMMPCGPTGKSMSNPARRGTVLPPAAATMKAEDETEPVTSILSANQLMPLAKIIEIENPKPQTAT